jgi:hypothetical protein
MYKTWDALPDDPPTERTGPVDYRATRRITGPNTYTFPHAGGWINRHNKRRKPIKRKPLYNPSHK